MRVVVVGAGFAGLMAATRLIERGHDVVVLEARDRVGGRVWSDTLETLAGPAVIERGAEFVLDGYDLMRSTAVVLGLTFADMGMSYYSREPRGGSPTSASDVAACARMVADAAAGVPRTTSLATLFGDLVGSVDQAALDAYASRIEVTNAYPLDLVSAQVVADHTTSYEPRPSFRVAGGNQRLAVGLAKSLGDRLRMSTPVDVIRWNDEGVTVRFAEAEVAADAVVVAVPLAIARDLDFEPKLPDWKMLAWGRSGLGQAAKLHVPMLEPVEPSAVQSVGERFWTWTAREPSGDVAQVSHCFSGSASTLEALEVASGPARWTEQLTGLRPELGLDVDGAVVTSWGDDPWAREAYTALTVDVLAEDDELMRRPVGPLHFAGEHTAGDWAGLMEGALRSGERAASEFPIAESTG